MRRLEPDIEALLEAEQLAMRPGPRPKSRPFVLEELRNAIKGTVRLKFWALSNRLIVAGNDRISARFMGSRESHFQPNCR